MQRKRSSRGRRGRPTLHGGGGPYEFYRKIGQGMTAAVYKAVHKASGHMVAVKVLNKEALSKQEGMLEKVRREMGLLASLKNPHVIRLYEVIESPREIYCVQELAERELFEFIVTEGRLTDSQSRDLFQQLICGLEYCHSQGIVHRDLKPENLLLDAKGRMKIADFGLANRMQDGKFLKTSCGSPNYAAPEVIDGLQYVGPEVDVWSSGVVLYVMLCGFLPFEEDNMKRLFRKIRGGIYTLPSHVGQQAKDLIRRMLVVDPMRRLTTAQIRDHDWFSKHLKKSPVLRVRNGMDPDILREIAKKGIKPEEVSKALSMGPSLVINPCTSKTQRLRFASVVYHVLLDEKLMKDDIVTTAVCGESIGIEEDSLSFAEKIDDKIAPTSNFSTAEFSVKELTTMHKNRTPLTNMAGPSAAV
ncbi:hypothetical protein AAMO2058_001553600, partial [Amorphochlora amoebiformis]